MELFSNRYKFINNIQNVFMLFSIFYLILPDVIPNISEDIKLVLKYSSITFILFSLYIKKIIIKEIEKNITFNNKTTVSVPKVKSENEKKWTNMEMKFQKDMKIILISNEPNLNNNNPNELRIGYVSHIEGFSKSNNPVVVYSKELNSEEKLFTMTEPLPYSKELEKNLLKLKWYERWNIYSRGISILTEKDCLRKEN